MFAAANTNGFLLLILHAAFLCSRHLWGNRGATDPDSIHSLCRRSVSTLCHAESLIVKSGRKSGLGNPGPQIQSADSLGPPVSTTGILQNYWHWHSPDHTNQVWKSSGVGIMFQAETCKVISMLCYETDRQGSKEANPWKQNVPPHLGGQPEVTVGIGDRYWGTKQNLQM